ncbi:MAG: carbonic anhydrase [Methylotenera sp.]|nr:carbonic anhydrase [Oligoflexia bacterium]
MNSSRVKKFALLSTISILFTAGLGCSTPQSKPVPQISAEASQSLETPAVSRSAGIHSPAEALAALQEGNRRFIDGQPFKANYLHQVALTKDHQAPFAAIVSCLDSRIPPEIVFDQGIGDVFVARVAGNIEDDNIIGSLEFATHVKNAKLILVMGHTGCGAVVGACKDVKLGHLTQLLDQIQPAVKAVKARYPQLTADSTAFQDQVAEENVRHTLADLHKKSSVIARLVHEGKLELVGGMYDVATGRVRILK